MKRFFFPFLCILFLSGCSFGDSSLSDRIEEERLVVRDGELVLELASSDAEKVVVEIFLKNPSQQNIQSVRSWVSFPSNILEGQGIEMNTELPMLFSAPGENIFDNELGVARIGFAFDQKSFTRNTEYKIAKLTFTRKKNESAGMNFFDPRDDGHTAILIDHSGGTTSILNLDSIRPLIIPAL